MAAPPPGAVAAAISAASAAINAITSGPQLDPRWLEPISAAYRQMIASQASRPAACPASGAQPMSLLKLPEEVVHRIVLLVEHVPSLTNTKQGQDAVIKGGVVRLV